MNDFEQLRGLLLGEEQARLRDLHQRIQDPASRARDLAEVLPEAVRAGAAADGRLANALQEPVGQCIQRSVERDPQRLADSLFPVMGPAISRAISETLKGFVQSINQAVEHSLSIRGLRWRVEAWRGGSSFAEVVLKNTLLYRVDAAYLIHNDTGLLIDHALATTQTTLKDEDAVSAMLTAIQDFVQDSFTHAGDSLETVEIGGRILWVLRGPRATLACVISGVPPQALRAQLAQVLREVHGAFAAALSRFDGDKAPLAAARPLLEQCLTLEYRDGSHRGRPVAWWPWLFLLFGLCAGVGWWWWTERTWQQRLEQAREALSAAPGIVLVHWRPQARILAEVLVDPLAAAPESLIEDPEIATRLDLRVRPYVSADPLIVLARAQGQLNPPNGVQLSLDRGVLRISGAAPPAWIERISAAPAMPPGVEALDLTALVTDHSDLLPRVRRAIDPPAQVDLRLDGTALILSGAAPLDWVLALPARLAAVEELTACDDDGLSVAEVDEARTLSTEIERIEVGFTEALSPLPGADAGMDDAAVLINRLAQLSQSAGLALQVRIIGHSDGVGTLPWNQWLRQQRADFLARQLHERGVSAALLNTAPAPDFEASALPSLDQRRAELRVELTIPEPPTCAIPMTQ